MEYNPADIAKAYGAFIPVYNKYYMQDPVKMAGLSETLFHIPVRTGWKEFLSTKQIMSRLEIQSLASGDAYRLRTATDLQEMGITDRLEAATMVDFSRRILRRSAYAFAPAPKDLYDAYVVLAADLEDVRYKDDVDVVRAFAKFAPAYLDFYAAHPQESQALSDGLFKKDFMTGWASNWNPTKVYDILHDIDVEMLAGGDAYRYRTAQDLVEIYNKSAKHRKDKLSQEDAAMFEKVAVRVLKGKYFTQD